MLRRINGDKNVTQEPAVEEIIEERKCVTLNHRERTV